MSAHRSVRRLTAAVAAAAALATGCSATALQAHRRPPSPLPESPTPHAVKLATFTGCDQLVQTLRHNALAHLTPYGFDTGPMYGAMGGDGIALRAPAADAVSGSAESAGSGGASGGASASVPAPAAPAPAGAGGSYSGTNNQEAGVDEPDLAKTDGRLLVVARDNPVGVQIYDVSGGSPQVAAFEPLPQLMGQPQLFLLDSLLVAVGPASMSSGDLGPWQGAVRAVVVDVADPKHPTVVRTFRVAGMEVDARMVADRVVLVMQSRPAIRMLPPVEPNAGASGTTLQRNRTAIRSAGVAQWLPQVTTTPSNRVFRPACGKTWHDATNTDTGVDTLSVVTFDPAHEDSVHQTTVVGTAGTVYASTTSLYVAATAWWLGGGPRPMAVDAPAMGAGVAVPAPTGDAESTQLYGFDISDPSQPRYLGAGRVAGHLTDQYAMSEDNGYLRVATTVGIPVPAPGEGQAPREESDNRVTVFQPSHGSLVEVGAVTGLGRGERIYGVRFLGDLGYVVTFRQIDPLYVLDLSDPRHPREVSHLEVTGYSAYLHPLGNGLLLGLGHQVDSRAHPTGEQLSVFDVTSPAHPTLRDRVYRPGADSPAENDHHAFLWWPTDRLVVVPLYLGYDGRAASAVYSVGTDGTLTHEGDLQLPAADGYDVPQRSIVVGDVLYTVSTTGLLASRLHGLGQVAWLPFR